MISLAAAFTAGFLVCAGYSIRKVRGLQRMIVADRAAALRQAVWRAGHEAERAA